MPDLIKKNNYFFIPYTIFFLIVTVFLILYKKIDIHIFLNNFHSQTYDYFFKYITHLGDGITIAIFIALLLLIRFRYSLIVFLSTIMATGIVQTLKRLVFPDADRPYVYFKGNEDLHFVEGVDLHIYNSFPSGHTATAFTIFLMLALMCKNKLLKFIFLIIALLTGYSRVYLSQHFLIDMYVGSLIAVVCTFIFYYIGMNKFTNQKLDSSLLKLKKHE